MNNMTFFLGKETDYLEHKCDKSRLKLGNSVLQQIYIHVSSKKHLHDTITIEVSFQQVGMGLGLNGISNNGVMNSTPQSQNHPPKNAKGSYITYTTIVL
jgi:hypothetical protein